jgi:hypothetical protein
MSNSNKFSVRTGEIRITGDQLHHLQSNGYVISAIFSFVSPQLVLEFEGSEDAVDGVMAEIVLGAFPRGNQLQKVSS